MGPNVEMRVIPRPAKLYRALRGTRLLPPVDRALGTADCMLGAGYVPWRGRNLAEIPVVYDLAFLRYPHTLARKHLYFLRWRLGSAVRNAPVVVTISEAIKDEIVEHYRLPRDRVRVVHPGCDLDRFAEGKPSSDHLDLPENYFLFVGTLEPRKNLFALLSAYRLLIEEQPDTPGLVIAGGTGWRVTKLVRELGDDALPDRIRSLGYVADEALPDLYAGATALVMPSHYEGFGIPPLEAMASGCPAITSGRGGLGEVVGDAGLLVDPNDPSSIAAAMKLIVDSPQIRADLVARGRKRAAMFTWQRSGEALRDAIVAGVGK